MDLIQIEVTNACNRQCANCTRLVGHHIKPFFMHLKAIEKAIESLKGFKGGIGLMGGEPTLHPHFPEICKLYREMIPNRRKRELWTSGYKWKEYKEDIEKTFDKDLIAYNDHSKKDKGWHQPLLIASDEIIEDKELMWKLIDKCWVQERWSASITTKGAFFCEVAAAIDHAFQGPGGYSIKKGWWKKKPKNFKDQMERYCKRCSAAIPLPKVSSHAEYDFISKENCKALGKLGSPKIWNNGVVFYNEPYDYNSYKTYFKKWAPGYYRDFIQHIPKKREKLGGKKTNTKR